MKNKLIEIINDLVLDNNCLCHTRKARTVEKILNLFDEHNQELRKIIYQLEDELRNWLK